MVMVIVECELSSNWISRTEPKCDLELSGTVSENVAGASFTNTEWMSRWEVSNRTFFTVDGSTIAIV